MQVRPATPRHLVAIRRLLAASDLPLEDLTPSHLANFFVARKGSTLVGVVGAELYDDVALLRSLATAIQGTDEAARLCPSSATCMHKRIDAASEESR